MKILIKQQWHFLFLFILLFSLLWIVRTDLEFLSGEYLSISSKVWFFIAILVPIVHQVYVLIAWRSELYYNSFTNIFGKKGFAYFKWVFFVLIISRPISLIFLSISNNGTLNISLQLAIIISVIFVIPSAYLFYSIKKYFGMDRAFGIDHFEPKKYATIPTVRKGIFRFTSNGMYWFGFLLLYIPGLLALSKAALLVAVFNHLYIWVHYYFTELPDMNEIYKEEDSSE